MSRNESQPSSSGDSVRMVRSPISSRIFALNKSWSKKVLLGLEYEDLLAGSYTPVIRLVGSDFQGIPFTYDQWVVHSLTTSGFLSNFEDVEKFFKGQLDCLDRTVDGKSWSLRYTQSYSKKAIEIIEKIRMNTSSNESPKRLKHSIVLHDVSFYILKNCTNGCIENWMTYVFPLFRAAPIFVEDIVKRFKAVNCDEEKMRKMLVELDDEIISTCISNVTKKTNFQLSNIDANSLFYEISTYHYNNIVE